ncbi:hypothetical protein BSKO_08681 [Bryopsis sp. KO-2023]|nr:hypothetical protein BSKO_08681 [Bryopsis sp. KO-2023]
MAAVEERKAQQSQCTWDAAVAGCKAAVGALAVSWPAVYLANKNFTGFRTRLGISGKTALVVSPVFFMFFWSSEMKMHECTSKFYDNNNNNGKKVEEELF